MRLPLAASLALVACLHAAEAVAGDPGAAPAEAAPAASWTLAAEDAAAIDRLIELALRNGLPDARGAVGVVGTLGVEWQGDPAHAPAALAVLGPHLSGTDIEATNAILRGECQGRHLRLADGSWLLGGSRHATPGDGFTITVPDDAREVAIRDLLATPAGEADDNRQQLRWRLGQALEWQVGRPALERALGWAPVDHSGRLDPLAVVHLWRAGAEQARDLALLASTLARGDDQGGALAPGTPPALGVPGGNGLLHQGLLPSLESHLGAFDPPRPGEIAAILRAAVVAWASERLIVADPPGRLAALAAAKALAAGDAALVANLDAIAAGRALPASAPADAPLSTRLGCWRPPDQVADSQRGVLDDGGEAFFLPFNTDEAVQSIGEQDLDALVALAADARPSRWIDGGLARTLGDNALRAVAWLLREDPRDLAGRPTDAPWSTAERNAVATGLARWWAEHRGRGVAALRAEAVVRKPLALALLLVQSEPDEGRKAGLAAALGRRWGELPPRPRDAADCLGELAAFLAEHRALPELATGLARWRRVPATAALIACWQALGGDGKAIPDLLAAACDQVDDSGDSPALLRRAIALAAATCDAPRLAALRTLVGSAGGPAWEVALAWLAQPDDGGFDGLDPLVEAVHPGGMGLQTTIRQALLHQLLGDARLLPEAVVRVRGGQLALVAAGDEAGSWPLGAERQAGDPAARLGAPLRRCDFAAWVVARHGGSFGLPDPWEGPAIDLTRPQAERDAAVAAARNAMVQLASAALEAAGLPGLDAKAPPPKTPLF